MIVASSSDYEFERARSEKVFSIRSQPERVRSWSIADTDVSEFQLVELPVMGESQLFRHLDWEAESTK